MTKLKSNCHPSQEHPELVSILATASLLSNQLQKLLSERSLGSALNVSHQAVAKYKSKVKGGSK